MPTNGREKLERLKYLANEAEISANQSKLVINEHCNTLRYEVVFTTESSIDHINKLSESLLEQIDAYEEELMRTYGERHESSDQDLGDLLKQTNELTSELEGFVDKLDSSAAELEAINQRYEGLCKRLKSFREEMFRKVYGGKYLRFIENISFFDTMDHLGTLENVKSPSIQTGNPFVAF